MSDTHVDAALASKPLARAVASAFGKSGLMATAVASIALSPSVFAATYTVGNTNDSGSSSLRDAIAQANANPGADTINFAANVSGTITLTTGSLVITDDVIIQGPGASVLTIDGNASVQRPSRPANYGFYGSDIVINGGGGGGQGRPASVLAASSVTISGLTFTGGRAAHGGGIAAYNTALIVDNCVVTGNYAYYTGGGIYIDGYNASVTVSNSTISNNTAGDAGGGVATTSSAITIDQSSVTGNSASGGGGIFIHNDNVNALTVTASTVSGNSASGANYYGYSGGGGVYARHVSATISNSTIANNTSARYGGGVIGHISGTYYATTLSNSTVSGNSATYGGGISETDDGFITLTNTAVGGNTATNDPDVSTPYGGSIATAFSLIGNSGAATITDNGGNLLNVAPQLGALANNGGPTLTMLPLTGSPLINAGDPAFSGLATDQRGAGFPRIINGRVDIGAVEFGTAAVAETVPAPALGLGGKLGLGALLGLAGLAVARRRRNLGTTAGILLAAALSVSSSTPAQAAQAGHESKHSEATTITSYTVQDKVVTIVLGDGQTLTARKGQVHIVDRRSGATHRLVRNPAKVTSGTPAAVRYETGKQGDTHIVRIRLTDTLQQAQALVANKP